MQPWLTILGLRDGYPLPPMAVQAVAGAHWVVGSEKNIAQLRQQLPNGWGKATKVKKLLRPFVKNIQWVEDLHRRDKKTRVIFLATGDPNFFG
ncbi:MAG: hypothetical protein ORN57_01165, partial [Alphaproteobacteria bacterium]|nr:hypothetical protein [Alphaproteobacteria bacterium]